MKRFLLCAIIIFAILAIPIRTLAGTFSDVPESSPYFQSIESLVSAGVLKGYEDGSFKPDDKVNRAEALKIILAGANIKIGNGLFMTGLTDVPLGVWYGGYVMTGLLEGIIKGNPDGTFAGDRNVNKAEFIKMTLQAFKTDLSLHQNLQEDIGSDTPASVWFAPYFSYAKFIGLIYPDSLYALAPARELTRGECAEIIYKMANTGARGEAQKDLYIAEARLIEALLRLGNNELYKAIEQSNLAIEFSNKALSIEPASTTAKATYLISQAFGKIFSAYHEILFEKTDSARQLIAEADNLAKEAVAINGSAQLFADKVNSQGNILLSQLN